MTIFSATFEVIAAGLGWVDANLHAMIIEDRTGERVHVMKDGSTEADYWHIQSQPVCNVFD